LILNYLNNWSILPGKKTLIKKIGRD